MTPSLYERAQNYVAKMPAAVSGQGGHNATFKVACVLLQGFNLTRSDARKILDEFNARCEPPWSDRELEHKLNQADKADGLETPVGLKPRGCLDRECERDDGLREPRPPSRAASSPAPVVPPARPEFSAEKLRSFAARWRGFVDTAWLEDRSPVQIYGAVGGISADAYLRYVFRDGEKVVIFTNERSQGQAIWPLEAIPDRGDEGVWYLAQPVDGRTHLNPRSLDKETGQPKESRRSEESVTDWRHLVLESDKADARDWMAALVQLPLRVVAIYTSGKRSIHVLVRVDAPTKSEWDNVVKQIRPILVTLGADQKAMSAVRLTRLPGCWRGDRLQKLLYLNPSPEPAPICAMPRLRDVLAPWLRATSTALGMTPAAVREQQSWELVEMCLAALRWYESARPAREALDQLTAWVAREGAA